MEKFSYLSSGVSINKGNKFVSQIKKLIQKDKHLKKSNIGGFSGQFVLDPKIKKPILVGATDGVGTKIEIANMMNNHRTIGIDLVAMCVNDLIVDQAKPIFFLDYIATGKLDLTKGTQIIKGIIEGCKKSNCSLLGGETAEHPGVEANDKYDLAGFCVGVKSGLKSIKPKLKQNDLIIGIKSSGLHSNGFSLVRKIIKEKKVRLNKKIDKSKTIGQLLLKPTEIYVDPILELFSKKLIKSCAHITGGGITENLPRSLTNNVKAEIDLSKFNLSKIFKWLHSHGIAQSEMLRTFNCGYGMIVILDKSKLNKFGNLMKKHKLSYDKIGVLLNSKKSKKRIKFIGKLNFND
tara:strand:- start:358 stop:1401 length:1044 start_codon:yes stop_codon:yes gene_type:complete